MYQDIADHFRLLMARVVPPLTVALLLLFSAVPVGLPGLSTIFPHFALIGIFYWSLYRPESLQVVFIFLISFVADVLLNMPFGVTAVMSLSLNWILVTQRHFFLGRSFFLTWLIFAGLLVVPLMIMWLVYTMIYQKPAPIDTLMFQYLMTVAIYPFIAWALIHLHRLIVERE